MKQIRFSDLPTSSQVNEADIFPIIQEGDNKKAQQSSIKDYSQYKNIPKINGHALSGNVTLDELGAQAPGEYLTEKELLDADLVTKVENANKADKNYGAENSGKYLGTDENGEIAPIDVKFSDDNKIIKMAQGNPTIINDSADWRLQDLKVYGQSKQDGTPTPESPVEIISKEVSEIKVCGTNIIEYPFYQNSRVMNGITFIVNKDQSITINGTNNGNGDSNIGLISSIHYTDGSAISTGLFSDKEDSNIYLNTFFVGDIEINKPAENVIVNGSKNYGIYLNVKRGATVDNVTVRAMRNYGSKLLPYEPYKGQTITLTEPITLRGIPVSSGGNVTVDGQQYVSDVVCEKDGVIGVERNIAEVRLSKGTKFNFTKNIKNGEKYFSDYNLFHYDLHNKNRLNCFSNIASYKIWSNNPESNKWLFDLVGNGIRINPPLEEFDDMTVEEMNTILSSIDTVFIGFIGTPTFEPLPDEIQAQYKALKSYYPNTVIQTGCWNETEYEVSLQSFVEDMHEKIKEVNNNNNKLLL